MKKDNLLKVLGFLLLFVIVLTWIIPAGSFASGTFTKGSTSPLGLFDIIKLPLSSVANFIQYAIVFLLIGGLYGIINKTGVYGNLINSIVKRFKNREKIFLITSIIFFALLASLTGLSFVLLIIVPFFMTTLLSMNYDRKTVLMATIGSILVGNIASTYGFTYNGYINHYFALKTNADMITKIVYFIILTFLLIMFVIKTSNLEKPKRKTKNDDTDKSIQKETKEIPLFVKTTNKKKSFIPLVVVFLLTFVILLIGMYNWYYAFRTEVFVEFNETVMGVKIFGYPIIQNLLGTISAIGYWSIYEMSIIIVILTFVIAWLYNLKFNEIKDGFLDGAKVMLKPAIYVVLANMIFHIVVITDSSSNIYYTMSDFVLGITNGFNAVTMTLFSFLSSFFFNDFTYVIGIMSSNLTVLYKNADLYQVIGLIMRSAFGIVMLLLPTSILLIGGLSYLEIPYKEWLKYVWKYILEVFVIMVIIVTLLLILI